MNMQVIKTTPTEAMTLGKAFAESGLFPDIKSAQQAVVKIMAGQEMNIGPFQSMNGIHIIQGKATVGAGLMAAMVKASGKYDYRVLDQTDKVCTIEFFQGKESIGKSTFTEADAKKSGTKNMEKYPANMLFARAMSNGCKWYTPDVFNGPVYVPEEMQQVEVQDAVAEVVPSHDDYVKQILACTDVDELKAVKASTPLEVQKDRGWIAAAKDRFNQLNHEAK